MAISDVQLTNPAAGINTLLHGDCGVASTWECMLPSIATKDASSLFWESLQSGKKIEDALDEVFDLLLVTGEEERKRLRSVFDEAALQEARTLTF